MAADLARFIESNLAIPDQQRTQPCARAQQPGLDCRQTETGLDGVIELADPVEVTTLDHFTVGGTQLSEVSMQALLELVDHRHLLVPVRLLIVEWGFRAQASGTIDERIARHPEQPGARIIKAAESDPCLHCAQKDIVEQIGGGGGIAQPSHQKALQFPLVCAPRTQHTVETRHRPCF